MMDGDGKQNETIAMTQVEAARELKITDRTLRNWEKAGIVRGFRVANGKRLYATEAIKALVKEKCQSA